MIKYSTPEMEIIVVDTEDIVLASTTETEDPTKPPELPDDNF